MNAIINLARPEVIKMDPYRSARSEQQEGKIWLDANENPWKNTRAELNRYPEPQPSILLSQFSKLYQVTTEQLIITRGSDEAIDLIIRAFCTPSRDAILICPPTYGMYQVTAILQGADVINVPLIKNNDFSLDVDGVLRAWNERVKLIFLCSPNNPTGNLIDKVNVINLCKRLENKSVIVVDEAYVEFSSEKSFSELVVEYPNLVVLRTLSKAYGLAGARCGVAIADPSIIQLLKKIIAPYPVPTPLIEIVLQRLSKNEICKVYQQINLIKDQRQLLQDSLSSLPLIKKTWSSEANFLLMEVKSVRNVIELCKEKEIVIRDRSNQYGLSGCVRISVGTPQQNKFLLEALSNA